MLSVSLLTTTQIILSLLLYAGVLLWALARVSWVELVADSRRQHLLFGSVFVLFVLWLLRKEFDNGLTFHFLGLTAITLMLDWPWRCWRPVWPSWRWSRWGWMMLAPWAPTAC